MADPISDNVTMLMKVVSRLDPLLDRFVFLGGVVTELFVTEPGAPGARQTKDVDLVVDVVNTCEYSESLREELIAVGLREDTRPEAPICRWTLDDMIIDIMPTRGDILGFSSTWYQAAFDSARPHLLPNGMPSTSPLVDRFAVLSASVARKRMHMTLAWLWVSLHINEVAAGSASFGCGSLR